MNTGVSHSGMTPEIANEYAQAEADSLMRQFDPNKEEKSTALRVSSLGKPAVLQALKVLGYDENGYVSNKMRHIFKTGDTFESYLIALCKVFGAEVSLAQAEVEFMGVKGHIDFVYNNECIVEVKTASPNYFSKFVREPNDDRGYITQAAIYSKCLNLPIYWLMLNKATHELAIVTPDSTKLESAVSRAERIIPLLTSISSTSDVLTKFRVPPAVEETYRRKKTGYYVMPDSMKYSSFAPLFYELEEEENKRYVTGYRDSETFLSLLSEYTQTA